MKSNPNNGSKNQLNRGGGVECVTCIVNYSTNPETKIFYKSGSRDVSDITGRLMSLFVGQQTNRRPVPSDFAGRHQEATITSQLVFNCRIIHEYRVSRRLTGPKMTTSNGKKRDFWQFTHQGMLSTSWKHNTGRKNPRLFLKSNRDIFSPIFSNHLELSSHAFVSLAKQLTGNSFCFLLPSWWVSSHFQHCDTWRKNWDQQTKAKA